MRNSLARSQNEVFSAKAKAEFLENFTKSLQSQLVAQKASSLTSKESKPSAQQKSSAMPEAQQLAKLQQDVEHFKTKATKADETIRLAESTYQKKGKNDLRWENRRLSSRIEDMKIAFDRMMADVNKSDCCEGCQRRWNFTLTHRRHTAFGIICKLCREEAWY